MFRTFALAVSLAFLGATAASAFDIENMTAAEKEAFGAEVRSYLIENPDVFLEIVTILEERRANEAAQAELTMVEDNRAAIFEDGFSYVGGNPDGDITIVEFLDYRCGFCKRAFPEVEELIASDGNIRIIIKEYPILGEGSILASRYAIATLQVEGDEAYKTVHDRLMTLRGEPSEFALSRLSDELGFDHDDIAEVMNSDEVTNIIQANYELARALQVQGTPAFVMGEAVIRGFVDLEQMRAIVADQRQNRG